MSDVDRPLNLEGLGGGNSDSGNRTESAAQIAINKWLSEFSYHTLIFLLKLKS